MRAQLAQSYRAMSGRHRSSTVIANATRPAMMEMLEERRLLSTYYVSASGSDSKSGTSQSSAWRSINRVNAQTLKAGDKVLFQGGKSFSGSLYVPSAEGGSSSSAVTFSTYGSGKAIINSGSKPGLDVAQTGGVAVSNLVFNGGGMHSNRTPGIYIHLDHSNKVESNVQIRNVEVKNYGRDGITFKINGRGGSKLSNVKIEDVSVHHNLYGGIKSTSMRHNNNKNWVIQRVKAFDNPGSRSTSDVTGSGIYIADVDGAMIQHNKAWNNGKDGNRPVGIWVAGSNRVTMQHNESYNNKTRSQSDGGGFDFDWDTHNSVMQYNYSHGNDGPGFLLYAGSTSGSGNTIRNNVSENDGRKNGKAGIQLGGNVTNAKIHNNKIYITGTGHYHSSALQMHDFGSNGKVPRGIDVRNNTFVATNGAKVVWTTSGVASKGSSTFAGNTYYSPSNFKIQWGSRGYSSLSAWRDATGKERVSGRATGSQSNPNFKLGSTPPSTGGTNETPKTPDGARPSEVPSSSNGKGWISGIVFDDRDKDGRLDAKEPRLSNRVVYIDANRNGKLDSGERSTRSSRTGGYAFANLASGTYQIRRLPLPGGFSFSNPSRGYHQITVSGSQKVVTAHFGTKAPTSGVRSSGGSDKGNAWISGIVFDDSDRDGKLDSREPRLSNRVVFIDANHNGKLDSGERSTRSSRTGGYAFDNLATGNYRIRRLELPGGFKFSTPSRGYHDITVSGSQQVVTAHFGSRPIA